MANAIHLFNIEHSSSESSSEINVQHDDSSAIEMTAMPIMQNTSPREILHRPKSAITRPSTYHEVDRVVPSAEDADDTIDMPKTPAELELSRPSSPRRGAANVAQALQTWDNPSMNKWRTLAACLFCLANGCNDSAPGALLPYIEDYYKIGYAIVSLVFVANAIGFILAAFFIHAMDKKFGRAKTVMFSDGLLIVAYVINVCTPPFPAFVISFFITGLGMATSLALHNVFFANLANSHVLLGLFHGSYGVGGIIAPFIATTLVSRGVIWSRFYFLILAFRIISFFLSGWAFWNFERDSVDVRQPLLQGEEEEDAAADVQLERVQTNKIQQLKDSLRNRATLAGALFIFAYQGAEVSTSGWVISFLISYRGGDPSKVGYVTSGFWGGITVGRFVLTHLGARIGEKLFVYFLVVGAVGLQLLVWLIPSVVGESVAVALLGLLLGPIYPSATVVFARLLPRQLQNSAIAFISSAGSSGGAIAPFVTGIIAQSQGTWVLHPICIGLFGMMLMTWWSLPKVEVEGRTD